MLLFAVEPTLLFIISNRCLTKWQRIPASLRHTIPGKISYALTADGALSEPAATTIPTPTPTAAPTPTPKPTLKPAPTPKPAVAQTPKSTAVFNPNTYTQSEMFPAGAIAAATMVVTLAATVMVKKKFEANDSLDDSDLESI